MPYRQNGSVRLVDIRHKCGHAGKALTNARNPSTAVDVRRKQGQDCPLCRAAKVQN